MCVTVTFCTPPYPTEAEGESLVQSRRRQQLACRVDGVSTALLAGVGGRGGGFICNWRACLCAGVVLAWYFVDVLIVDILFCGLTPTVGPVKLLLENILDRETREIY